MSGPDKTASSRIAIKLGTAPSGGRATPPSRPAPRSTLGKRSRPRLHAESDSENDGRNGGAQEITVGVDGYAVSGETEERSTKQPLAIPRQPNRNWRSELGSKKSRTTTNPDAASDAIRNRSEGDDYSSDQDKPLKWGLSVNRGASGKRQPASEKQAADGSLHDPNPGPAGPPGPEDEVDEAKPRTADDEALDALMGKTTAAPKALVIERESPRITEDDAFRRDSRDAPGASTLEEYEEMPVEEFGAALLRGMGWDGKPRGPKTKDVKRRPNQIGLGAKSLKGEEDLGSWNQGHNGGKPRPPRLSDYRRQERERQDDQSRNGSRNGTPDRGHRESYKEERDREHRESRVNGHRYRNRWG